MSLISIPTQKTYISNKIKLKFSNISDLKNDIEKRISKDITKQLTEALNDVRGDSDDQNGRSFSDITLLALAYFYTEIFPHTRENNYFTINVVKGFLDAHNLSQYTTTHKLDAEYYELLNAPLFNACWLIIQSAWFFNSKHFGKHQYVDYVCHYAKTGKKLPIENYKGDSAYLEKKYRDFEKQTGRNTINGFMYVNAWYYGILFLVCNELRLPINNFKVTIKYDREYNPLPKVPRALRHLAPFIIAESDINSAFATFIDKIIGSNLKDSVYNNVMSLHGITRSEAKVLFNRICNSGKYKSKTDTMCFFVDWGYSYKHATDLLKLTHNEEKGFYHFMTYHEKNAVETFKIVNDLLGCVRLHDSVLFIYKGIKPQILVVNGNCEFGFKLLNSPVYNSTLVLPETSLDYEITNSFVEPLDDNLSIIINEINKYKRMEGELLNGYIGDVLHQLIKFFSVFRINIFNSPPSSGKTSMVVQLREEGNRCLLIVPTTAIIKNKKIVGFKPVYGNIEIKKYIDTTYSLICTFDKGSQLTVDDLLKFDYIIIDESHLLFTEGYRMNALVLLLKKIESYMQNLIKNSIPTNSTKIILMSGTPTGEEFFFEPDEKGEPITHKKVFINNKERNAILVGCVDEDSCYTSFINKIIELINNNHRVFIPTDRGEKWINAVVGVLSGVIGRDIKFEIYSNNQKDSPANIDINTNSIISGDTELLFSTSLGNAGIDINNTDKRTTMVIYTDKNNPIIGQKIIQYANRFRNENVQIIVFFILPKEIKFINQEFGFDYIEDPNEMTFLNNEISTQLYTNELTANMLDDFVVDKVKVKWKALNQKLEEHFSNIVSIGGYFKTMGYDVTAINGDETDYFMIKKRKEINVVLNQLEYDGKIKALDFILTDVCYLIQSLSNYTRKKGEYYLIKETLILTLENQQIFDKVQSLVKKFVNITDRVDAIVIEKFMLKFKMDFKDIENRLKLMKFVNNDCVDPLDNMMVKEVDKLINLNEGVGSISKQRYYEMLEILAPKYINKAYNDLDQNRKQKLIRNLKSKLNICYSIKIGKVVTFKQRFTDVWINETICWFKDLYAELTTEAPVNERILRNRKGEAKGLAVGKAIGKAYEHIAVDLIDNINRIVDTDGYITAKYIIEITDLTSNNLGGFVKAKLSNLKPSVKMINGARETRYYK